MISASDPKRPLGTPPAKSMRIPCTLSYLVSGVANADSKSTQAAVCEEIRGVLNHSGPVTAEASAGGLLITISVTDIAPFSAKEFEPYVHEQVLWHSIFACCQMEGDNYEFKLMSSYFE